MIKVKHEPKCFCEDKARTVSTMHINHLSEATDGDSTYFLPTPGVLLPAKKLSMCVGGKGEIIYLKQLYSFTSITF